MPRSTIDPMSASDVIVEVLEQAFEEIFREHYRMAYRTAYGVLGNFPDADDVAQTVFVRLLCNPGKLQPPFGNHHKNRYTTSLPGPAGILLPDRTCPDYRPLKQASSKSPTGRLAATP
jgi:hypothetical protein